MRIVIDMQGAQSESRFRGIGRYTMSFTKAIVRNRKEHEIILALSSLFPETIEPIRAAFDGLLPQEKIVVWYAPGPVMERTPGNDNRREVAELIREAFLASLKPDVIHITSLFEGYVDDAVTSIGKFDQRTPVSVTLYDLIPLVNQEHYLKPNPRYEQYYRRKLESLKKASLYLAISEFTCQEGRHYLSASSNSFINVSTAVEDDFQPQNISDETARRIFAKFGLRHPFVLYTGAIDERKNLPRLIHAYAALSASLRASHQLVFAGKIPESYMVQLRHIAEMAGLKANELIFTGYVSDEELVQLYNLSRLFVFPSWHEGFGLPALEAMACGAPVIGANTSSLPEVIGLEEALFDPFDVKSITSKMTQSLEDESFRQRLQEHGLRQAKEFSWDKTAKRAMTAWEGLQPCKTKVYAQPASGRKPRLAFVSPLPPERTGVADYSAELLPALSTYYDIEVIVAQKRVEDPWINQHGRIRDVNWLRTNLHQIDRVLYQVGNSPFHQHMLPLMTEIPGVVVLHDFYMNELMAWLELHGGVKFAWTQALYHSHGYAAVLARYQNVDKAKINYPVNGHVVQHALGIIVHSEYSRELARKWYGPQWAENFHVVPHVRIPSRFADRQKARIELGITEKDFLVCSFGFLGDTKLNHRLLQAWLRSSLCSDTNCYLVFVGENQGDAYGTKLLKTIADSDCKDRILITGFAPTELFKRYLAAADVAVQLRTQSRGETSGAVLHCMNYGLPVIVNAHGSMAELDRDAVWMLPDEFEDSELVDALEKLRQSPTLRDQIGARARNYISAHHSPEACARQYVKVIEGVYSRTANSLPKLIQSLANKPDFKPSKKEMLNLAVTLARNHPLPRLAKRLYLDVSATCRHDLKTGIQRVARALTLALIESPPEGYRTEPVYLNHENGAWFYRYARRYTLGLLGCPSDRLEDAVVEPEAGDILLTVDFSGNMLIHAVESGFMRDCRNRGVSIYAMVYDLLPVRMPEVFPPGADQIFALWLKAVSAFDGAICISKAVADDLRVWFDDNLPTLPEGRRPYSIEWFHLGADVLNSAPTRGVPIDGEETLQKLKSRVTFLMVGTIEPRKAYLQTIHAFDQLWANGLDVNLVIVGHEGWKHVPNDMRRDIPQTIELLRSHPERNNRLFWLEGISDEYLEKVYAASTCLIAASYSEGFGLPLIEAAHHKLPIIARDIPVFREVAGDFAYYFPDSRESEVLSTAIKHWLTLYKHNRHPQPDAIPWLTWKMSAKILTEKLFTFIALPTHT
ncbi:MAG: glycosyltransferase [Desulfosoma sp.]